MKAKKSVDTKPKKPNYKKTETFQDYKTAASQFTDYNPKSDTVFVGMSLDPGAAESQTGRAANISKAKGASDNNYNAIPKMYKTKNESGQTVYVSLSKHSKYSKGGVLPSAIKKLKERAATKKAEKSKPKYGEKLNEVTVTAKAPTKSEKAGAKAFVESNSVSRLASYSEASGGKDGSVLQADTAKRLNVPNTPANIYTSNKRKKKWNKALRKSGYRK